MCATRSEVGKLKKMSTRMITVNHWTGRRHSEKSTLSVLLRFRCYQSKLLIGYQLSAARFEAGRPDEGWLKKRDLCSEFCGNPEQQFQWKLRIIGGGYFHSGPHFSHNFPPSSDFLGPGYWQTTTFRGFGVAIWKTANRKC